LFKLSEYSALTLLVGQQEGHQACKKPWGNGCAISLVGVAPTRTVGTSTSIIFPCSIRSRRQVVGKPSPNEAQPYAKGEGRVFLLVPAYPGCPGTKAVVVVIRIQMHNFRTATIAMATVAAGTLLC